MSTTVRLAAGFLLIIGIEAGAPTGCVSASPAPAAASEADRGPPRIGGAARLMYVKAMPTATRLNGARITLKPEGHRLTLKATITNRGNRPITLWVGNSSGWSLLAFGSDGGPVRRTMARRRQRDTAPATARKPSKLKPGQSLSRSFKVDHYRAIRGPGVFYIYVTRWVGARAGVLGSPILKLTLQKGMPPVWRVVRAVPSPQRWPHVAAPVAPPPYPPHKIPLAGPVATLAEISKAVHAHDLKRVKQLCYHGGSKQEPFILANAREAIAIGHFCAAMKRRFNINPEKRLTRSRCTPETFSNFLVELDLGSLKIHGDRASVGVLWFNGKKFVTMPGFAFHFRKVRGHWLVDSLATYNGTREPRQYRMNVKNAQELAKVFDSLARDLKAGKFGTLKGLNAAADRRLDAVDDWFMSHGPKVAVVPAAGAPTRQALMAQRLADFRGVHIKAVPGRGETVTATVANHGTRTAYLHGWGLCFFGANGRGSGATLKQQANWQAAAGVNRVLRLAPGASVHKTFNVKDFYMIPTHGTFYIYLNRLVVVGRQSFPIRSSYFQMTLRKGKPPRWRTVAAMPQPKPIPSR